MGNELAGWDVPSSTSAWGCLRACLAQTLGRLLPFLFGSLLPKQEFSAPAFVTLARPRQASHLTTAETGPGAGRSLRRGLLLWAGRSYSAHPVRMEKWHLGGTTAPA